MKTATAIGIVAGVVALLFASMMEGTQPMAFFNIPALIIVLVGTGGATLSSVGMDVMKKIPALYKLAFGPPELDMRATTRWRSRSRRPAASRRRWGSSAR